MKELKQIDLRGTHVSNLDALVELKNLYTVFIDYDGITIATETNLKEKKGEATAVEKLFNSTYGKARDKTMKYPEAGGVILCSKALIEQLKYSTNISNFQSFAYPLPACLGDAAIEYDLSNSKISQNFYYGWGVSTGTATFKLPATIEKCTFWNARNREKVDSIVIDDENAKTLLNLKSIEGSNSNWDEILSIAKKIPDLKSLYFYTMYYGANDSLDSYVDDLASHGLESLSILGWETVKNTNPLSYEKLKSISKIETLKILKIFGCGNLTNFSFLNNLTNLEELDLQNNGLNSLSFIKNLSKLKKLVVSDNNGLNLTGFDDAGKQINNLDLIKNAYKNNLRTVDIRSTGITAEEISASEIKKLEWTSFLP